MTKRAACGWVLAAMVLAEPTGAQNHQPMQHEQHHSPNAEQEPSGIASLSRQELDDLLAGAGMGLARPAELNQYPGPKHVLELAADLELDARQRERVETIRLEMLEEAQRLGKVIVEKEQHLDRRFAHRHIDEATLHELTAEIAHLYGELRFVHLRAHHQTREVLTADQVAAYDRLRGYQAKT